ncbi:MAG: pyridoxine 5'-phosphate synthase [Paludibacteraceae bacterium]|nr:pyridoxine 5'-phosphate synthase [Paludibacteraceae bacterium]
MTQLSVNVNKIATIRNARGGNNPDVLKVALDCERFGAQGITVHPRPDERHITGQDVLDLKPALITEFNIEGNPDERFIELVSKVKPAQVTLVPDAPGVLTSNAGWDCIANFDHLKALVDLFKSQSIRVSIFVGTDIENIKAAARTGADRIELYTEPYAAQYHEDREAAVAPYVHAAVAAHELGLGINAGHDLDLHNLAYFHECVPFLDEVSIGHALICDALYLGLEETIKRYLDCLK